MQGNNVAIKGSLTKDAEIRVTQSGRCLAIFSIAWNTRRKDESGEWVNDSHYFDCKAWLTERQADVVAPQLTKGAQIAITAAHLGQDKWTDSNGNNRSRTVIWVDDPIGGMLVVPRETRPTQPAQTSILDEDIPF